MADLFAYDQHESELAEDELSILMASVLKVFTRMELIENVPDAAVEPVAGEAFIDPEDGTSRDLVSARDLSELSLGFPVRGENSRPQEKDKHGRAASEKYQDPVGSNDIFLRVVQTVQFFPRLLKIIKVNCRTIVIVKENA